MGIESKIAIKNSIATKMLLVVLGLYLLIATGGILSHIWMEYSYQKKNIIHDLGDIENAFADGLAVSLWGLDKKALVASVAGMLKIPTLVGVQVSSDKGVIIAIGGIVKNHGQAGKVELSVSLSGLSDKETAINNGKLYAFEMFERQFPIRYDFKGESRLLGQVTIYSDSSVIYRRIKLQVVMLVINVLMGLVSFSLLLWWAVNYYFRRPLTSLASATEKISLDNLDSFQVKIGISGHNELTILERSFNLMIGNLNNSLSKHKQAEAEIKIFQSMAAASTDAIGMATPEGSHYYQNEAFGRMFGKIDDGLPTAVYQDQDVASEVFETIMAGGQWIGEVKMLGLDNRLMDILLRAYAVRAEDGSVVNLVGVHTDITESKQAAKSLAAEKERLAVTLRSIGDGVITTDIKGNIVLMNKVAERLTGWSGEDALGLPLTEVFHIINEQNRKVCDNPVIKVIDSGQVVGLANHTTLISKDGTERSIADSGAPILDTESNIVGVVLVFRDVTNQIKTEKELLKIKKLESIGVLAGGIAHDFNNILAAILGNINLALFDDRMGNDTRNLLSEAEKASLRAKDLTQQLLTFAKGGEPVKEISSLEDVINDSAGFVLHGDKVACRYDIPADLWLVDIDKGQMSQVIQNIVINASQAMPEGGTINIAGENLSSVGRDILPFAVAGNFVKISLADSGIGMLANVVEKIFDPYFSTKQEGSGLGLAISQSIIHKHKGHISVDSFPGVGTTFTLYIPAAKSREIEKEQSVRVTKTASKAKILIMDDDEMVKGVAKAMLKRLGHEVELSSHGEETVWMYQEAVNINKPFDLVILDLTIPGGMGGKEAVREIKNINPDAKVIVSSGYSNDPIMADFKPHGFCAAIVKPYQFHELSKVINEAMR